MNKKKRIFLILIFLIGLGLTFYPTFSDMYHRYRSEKIIQSYKQVVSQKDTTQLDKYYKDAKAYNNALVPYKLPDAFEVKNGKKDISYESLLNVNNDGMMGSIEIPSISVNIPIYHYTYDDVLEKGAGHLFGSSLPVGGKNTHSVISAHRGLPEAKLFTDLDQLELGDQFIIHVLNKDLYYEVDSIKTVEPTQTEDLKPVKEKDYVTLLTCTPYGVNTHRLLVRGHRIQKSEYIPQTQKSQSMSSILWTLLCIVIGIALAIFLVRIYSHYEKKKKNRKS